MFDQYDFEPNSTKLPPWDQLRAVLLALGLLLLVSSLF